MIPHLFRKSQTSHPSMCRKLMVKGFCFWILALSLSYDKLYVFFVFVFLPWLHLYSMWKNIVEGGFSEEERRNMAGTQALFHLAPCSWAGAAFGISISQRPFFKIWSCRHLLAWSMWKLFFLTHICSFKCLRDDCQPQSWHRGMRRSDFCLCVSDWHRSHELRGTTRSTMFPVLGIFVSLEDTHAWLIAESQRINFKLLETSSIPQNPAQYSMKPSFLFSSPSDMLYVMADFTPSVIP